MWRHFSKWRPFSPAAHAPLVVPGRLPSTPRFFNGSSAVIGECLSRRPFQLVMVIISGAILTQGCMDAPTGGKVTFAPVSGTV
jgi:hypothetical protein